jgi:hypothetical protein
VVIFRLLVCLLFAAALAAANPFVETYLSEICVDSAHQFVEIHAQPDNAPVDLFGWHIVTSTSSCNLRYQMQYDEYMVVDSASLASGWVGYGSLRLNPLGDSVLLVTDSGWVADVVYYPSSPSRHKYAPLPPSAGSIAFWNYDDFEGQSMNWYVDSVATPRGPNCNYSEISGSIRGADGHTFSGGAVTASGANGYCHYGLYQTRSYCIGGLGAGTYEVVAYVTDRGYPPRSVFPESVTVGYHQSATGIDFVIPLEGVAETQSAPLLPLMRVSGRALLLSGDGTARVNVQLYNQVGSRVGEFRLGPFNGEKRIELPATLAPGVYFSVVQKGTNRSTAKVVLW